MINNKNGGDFEAEGQARSASSQTEMLEDKHRSKLISSDFLPKGVCVPSSGPSKRANGNVVAKDNNFINTPDIHVFA